MLTTEQKTRLEEEKLLLKACQVTLELYGYRLYLLDEQATETALRERLKLSGEQLAEAMEMMQERAEAIKCRS